MLTQFEEAHIVSQKSFSRFLNVDDENVTMTMTMTTTTTTTTKPAQDRCISMLIKAKYWSEFKDHLFETDLISEQKYRKVLFNNYLTIHFGV